LDFAKAKKQAESLWDKQLAKIDITESNQDKKLFYTALYHTMVQPNIAQDIDGKYRGRDKVHEGEGFDYYSVFSHYGILFVRTSIVHFDRKKEQLIL
jgi:putative alpha-1,2-mannosidase